MNYAIIEINKKQYKVTPEATLNINYPTEKIPTKNIIPEMK